MLLNPYVKIAIVSLTLLGGGAYLHQERNAEPQDKTGKLVLDAGSHSLPDLIARSATFLRRNYLFSEGEFTGQPNPVVLQNRLELDATGCEEILSQLLYAKGFAIVPLDPSKALFEVINMQGPKRNEIQARAIWMTPDKVLEHRNSKMVVLCSVDLEFVNAQTATTALRPFFSSSRAGAAGLIPGNVGNNRAMLLQGFADQVSAAIELLKRVDVPDEHADKEEKALEARIQKLEQRVEALEKR